MEFELIERIRRRAATRTDVVLGIGDDAALLRMPAGHDLVVTADTLNAGVHFPHDTSARDIGWKALAVNLSDLAAMGATPAWCTLSLSLPEADGADLEAFLDAFLDGFMALADSHQVALVGGDTTRGPLSIAVTAHGLVPTGTALRRTGARVDDDVWITGTPGDAAAALAQWRAGANRDPALRARLDRPLPRVAAGLALRGLATACIDVSDGLLADLLHLLCASEVGAGVDLAQLPTSDALRAAFVDDDTRHDLQLAGGDDYELCFTAPAHERAGIAQRLRDCDTPATVIGRIEALPGLRVRQLDGTERVGARCGWDHFSEQAT